LRLMIPALESLPPQITQHSDCSDQQSPTESARPRHTAPRFQEVSGSVGIMSARLSCTNTKA
jgi:hypothetical protein